MSCRDVPAWMRAEEEGFLVDRCDVYEPPAADESHKGEDSPTAEYPDDYTAILTDEPCRYDMGIGITGKEGTTAGRLSAEADGILTLRHHAPVTNTSKIRITTMNNKDLEVIRIREISDEISRQVEVKEIT